LSMASVDNLGWAEQTEGGLPPHFRIAVLLSASLEKIRRIEHASGDIGALSIPVNIRESYNKRCEGTQ